MYFPYFPFYIEDYLRDTEVLRLDEVGAYIRLLAHMWRSGNERGACSLPDDDKLLAGLLHASRPQWKRLRVALVDNPNHVYLHSEGGQLTQKRLAAEWAHAQERSEARSAAARARWDRPKEGATGALFGPEEGSPGDAIACAEAMQLHPAAGSAKSQKPKATVKSYGEKLAGPKVGEPEHKTASESPKNVCTEDAIAFFVSRETLRLSDSETLSDSDAGCSMQRNGGGGESKPHSTRGSVPPPPPPVEKQEADPAEDGGKPAAEADPSDSWRKREDACITPRLIRQLRLAGLGDRTTEWLNVEIGKFRVFGRPKPGRSVFDELVKWIMNKPDFEAKRKH